MPGAKALQSTGPANGLVLNDSTARTMVQSLAAVLDCVERLMSQSAALPVPVPNVELTMLCSRILSVDDSLTATGAPLAYPLAREATLGTHSSLLFTQRSTALSLGVPQPAETHS